MKLTSGTVHLYYKHFQCVTLHLKQMQFKLPSSHQQDPPRHIHLLV